MLQQILETIKGDKQMSFKHWRYRLLHWFFNINPETPDDSSLPRYFYTHFCPLFHLTNLIAIFSPVILLFKIIWFVGALFFKGMFLVISWFVTWMDNWRIYRIQAEIEREEAARRELTDEEIEARRLERLTDAVLRRLQCASKEHLGNFDLFWQKLLYDCDFCVSYKESEVKLVWEKYAPKILQAKLKQEERKNRFKERMLFWVNFSRVFIKGLLNVFYVALAALVGYLTVVYGFPILWFLGEFVIYVVGLLFDLNWLSVIRWTVGLSALGLVSYTLSVVLLRSGVIGAVLSKCSPVLNLIVDVFGALFGQIGKMVSSLSDFISVFYEENCPAIKIVNDREASIAAIEEEDE